MNAQLSRVQQETWNERENLAATKDTAKSVAATQELIDALVKHSIETANAAEVRERQMLRWTQAGVVLAGIAAVASIVAIVVTLLVA